MDSLLSNLKNKVKYNLHQAVNDPDANEFAANQPESPPPVTEKVENDDYFEISTTDDPNRFNGDRLLRKIGNQTIRMIKNGFFPVIALILSMYVTNEMIVYSAPIRLIFFIVTFLICHLFTPFLIILAGYYLCKSGYGYYLNNLSDGPKTKIMPTIFALLPLTTDIPVSSLGAFFMYPFTYPKNDKDAKKLPIIMNNYMESLKKSFAYFDKIKNLPFVAEGIKRLEASIEHLHDIPVKSTPVPSSTSSAPLPATIELPKKEPSALKSATNNTITSNKPSTSLPATIELPKKEPSESESAPNNTTTSNKSSAPLPATIELPKKETSESESAPNNTTTSNKSSTTIPATIELPKKETSVPESAPNNTPTSNKSSTSVPATIQRAKQPNTPSPNK